MPNRNAPAATPARAARDGRVARRSSSRPVATAVHCWRRARRPPATPCCRRSCYLGSRHVLLSSGAHLAHSVDRDGLRVDVLATAPKCCDRATSHCSGLHNPAARVERGTRFGLVARSPLRFVVIDDDAYGALGFVPPPTRSATLRPLVLPRAPPKDIAPVLGSAGYAAERVRTAVVRTNRRATCTPRFPTDRPRPLGRSRVPHEHLANIRVATHARPGIGGGSRGRRHVRRPRVASSWAPPGVDTTALLPRALATRHVRAGERVRSRRRLHSTRASRSRRCRTRRCRGRRELYLAALH